MHIDRTNQVTMTCEPALLAVPNPAFGFVLMPTSGTLATCSSFGASEAQDAGLFGFVGEIVNVFAIFPQRHALIVVSAIVTVAHAMRIADEERSYLLLNTEGDDLSRGLMPHVAHTPFSTSAHLLLGALQFLPATRIFLAVGLLLGNFAQAHRPLPLERTDTPSGDDHGLAGVGGDGGKVDFAQINGSLVRTWGICGLWYLDTHVQFKAVIPNKATRTAMSFQFDGQDDGFTPLTHGQNHTPVFAAHSLSGPLDWIKALGTPRILHLHLGMGLTKFACGEDISKKRMDSHLHRLAMQGKSAFGGLLQLVASRPLGVRYACLFMQLHTPVPHLCCSHLSGLEALKHRMREVIKPIDFYGVHEYNSSMETSGLQVGKTRYTHYSIAYHLVWIPKYRRKILTGEVQAETKRLITACCERHGLTLLALETDIDHIHVFVSAPPRFSPALIANLLKGYSSRYLREKFPWLKKVCGKDHLWTSSYYVGTAGAVSAETITRYITDCQGK